MWVEYSTDTAAGIWAFGALIALCCGWWWVDTFGMLATDIRERERRYQWWLMASFGVAGMLASLWFLLSAIGKVI